jgi:hypothetical protein
MIAALIRLLLPTNVATSPPVSSPIHAPHEFAFGAVVVYASR